MNLSNFFVATSAAVMLLLNITGIVDVRHASIKVPNTVVIPKVDGGPRTVIQAMTEIVVNQPTATNLSIKVIDSTGVVVIEETTQSLQTRISTTGLKPGTYTVETIDDYDDLQVFTVVI